MKGRLVWIDAAKGLGTILVVYGHVMRGLDMSTVRLDHDFFLTSDKLIYSFHMPLFFILSGFFFSSGLQKRGYSLFVAEKAKTLIYPFVIWSIIQTSIEVVLSKYTNNHAQLSDLLWCLVVPKAQFWFLYTLFFVALFNVLMVRVFTKYALYISFLVSLILFEFNPSLGPFNGFCKFLIFYNIGVIVSFLVRGVFFRLQFFTRTYLILFNLAVFVGAQLLYLYFNIDFVLKTFVPQITGSLLVIQTCMVLIDKCYSSLGRGCELIGKYSFQIYLVHILVASGCRIVLVRIFGVDNFYIHVVAGTILGILVPMLIASIANRTRYLKWLFIYPEFGR